MAFNDTLFQLGMDLTRSSTAQTEELGEAALLAAQSDDAANDRFPSSTVDGASALRTAGVATLGLSAPTIGTHVTIDVHGDVTLQDFKTAVATLTRLVDDAGATLQHLHVHPVSEGGAVSGVAVLGDGHISFHSRPAVGYVALDISTFGGTSPNAWTLAAKSAFGGARISARVHRRGETVGESLLSAVLPPRRSSRTQVKTMRAKAA